MIGKNWHTLYIHQRPHKTQLQQWHIITQIQKSRLTKQHLLQVHKQTRDIATHLMQIIHILSDFHFFTKTKKMVQLKVSNINTAQNVVRNNYVSHIFSYTYKMLPFGLSISRWKLSIIYKQAVPKVKKISVSMGMSVAAVLSILLCKTISEKSGSDQESASTPYQPIPSHFEHCLWVMIN